MVSVCHRNRHGDAGAATSSKIAPVYSAARYLAGTALPHRACSGLGGDAQDRAPALSIRLSAVERIIRPQLLGGIGLGVLLPHRAPADYARPKRFLFRTA